jgi:16S rRNA (cytosine967-C5)-methyltransferase
MNSTLEKLAVRIVRECNRDHPADGVLRNCLKNEPGLSRQDSTEVSRAVFAYHRWFGWLDPAATTEQQFTQAAELAERVQRDPSAFSVTELTARAVPQWISEEMEIKSEWVRTLQTEPKLWLRARPGQGTALAERLGPCFPFGDGPLSDILEYRGSEDLFRTAEFHAGEFELQDISSQAVGLVCAPEPRGSWWDACAGEGGKLLHLSDLMQNKGLIWATDLVAWRLERLKRRASRAKVFNYRSRLWDGGPKLPTKTKFDGVLVDAPCSGIGTWQRNPHARWTLQPQDVPELAELQARLLSHAAASVKPGGKLVYSVCTLANSETTGVTKTFEAKHPDFKKLPIVNPLVAEAKAEEVLWLWPQDAGGNGMFVAVWERAG